MIKRSIEVSKRLVIQVIEIKKKKEKLKVIMSLINHDQRDHLKLLRENGTDGNESIINLKKTFFISNILFVFSCYRFV